jgi:hypothetical protein
MGNKLYHSDIAGSVMLLRKRMTDVNLLKKEDMAITN